MSIFGFSKRIRDFVIAIGTLALMSVMPAYGQESDSVDTVDEILDEVLVTGSHIKRSGYDTVSNLIVIDRAALNAAGVQTIADVMRYVTANTGGNLNLTRFSQGQTVGEANFNLRGLGSSTTLVLINGRRYTKSPQVDETGVRAVDMNSLPFNMIERVEILKAGASAIYGSDGIAGVVNVITRKGIDGIEAGVNYQVVDAGGSDEFSANLAFGMSGDRGHAAAYFNFFERTAMKFTDGTFSKDTLLFSTTVHPASFRVIGPGDGMGGFAPVQTNLGVFPGGPDGGPRIADPDCLNLPGQGGAHVLSDDTASGGVSRCLGNIVSLMDLTVPETRTQIFLEGGYDISDSISLYGEASFSDVKLVEFQPGQEGLVQFGTPVTVPADHPANVFGVDLKYVGALTNPYMNPSLCPDSRCGTRAANRHNITTLRAVGGVEIQLNDVWAADLNYQWSKNNTDRNGEDNRVDVLATQLALEGRGGFDGNSLLNPFASAYLDPNLANSPELLDWLFLSRHDINTVELKVFEANFSGVLGSIGGRPIGVAFGLQNRQESLTFDVDSHTNQNLEFPDSPGIPDAFGTQDINALYVEASLPLLDNLELQLAVRYEDYGSTIGNTTDPKIAARWDVTDRLSFRGSFGTSFRGPDIVNTSVDTFSNDGGRDPVRLIGGQLVCTRTAPNDPFVDDRLDDIFTATRGGTGLTPEESESIDFGVIFRPLEDLQVSVDYWSIDYTDIMSRGPNGTTIVENDCFDDGLPNDPRISRDPNTGRVIIIETSWINAAAVETNGIDIGLSYRWETGWGSFTSDLQSTYVDTFDIQLSSDGPVIDGAGSRNRLNPFRSVPDLRTNLYLGWAQDSHAINVALRHIDEYKDDNPAGTGVGTIDSMLTVDMQYEYQLERWNSRVAVGLFNAFDEAVPKVPSEFFVGYDSRVHDPRGRMFYVNLTSRF